MSVDEFNQIFRNTNLKPNAILASLPEWFILGKARLSHALAVANHLDCLRKKRFEACPNLNRVFRDITSWQIF